MDARNQLPIYHVHGFLPQSGELSQDNQVTFGESIYHQQYSDTYSWNNIVQINKFREKTCLFIGTSLSDPNVRRLLDIAKKQKGNDKKVHFIFKLRNDVEVIKSKLKFIIEKDEEQSSVKDINLEETAKFLIDIVERFEEADTDSFGVKTVWVNDWNEVPDILREMRESAIK